MARIETDPNYSSPTFSRATAATDPFKKEDVQNLAAAFSVHIHDNVGKGLGVSGSGLNGHIDVPDWYRSTGFTSAFATTGSGMEMYYDQGNNIGVLQAYNRAAGLFRPARLLGLTVGLFAGTGSEALHIAADGSAAFTFPVTCNSSLAVAAAANVTGSLTVGSTSNLAGRLTTTALQASGAATLSGGTIIAGGHLHLNTGNVISFQSGGQIYDGAANQVNITNIGTGAIAAGGGITSGGNITTPNQVGAGQFMVGVGGQYILPVGAAIRYATIAGGGHSFEFVAGGYAACSASAFTVGSARKYKTDIRVLDAPLSIVLDDRVHGVHYTDIASGKASVGFIADDWVGVLPEIVVLDDVGDVQGFDYDRAGAVTFEALKQYMLATNARLDALEAKP